MSCFIKSRIVQEIMVLLVLPGISGCATIISGTSQQVSFTSEPSGARVTVGDKKVITPATLDLSRSNFYVVQFSKDGYHTAEVALRQEENMMVFVNIGLYAAAIIPGIVALMIDVATGAQWKLDPEKIQVQLTPRKAGEPLRIESIN